MPAKRRDCNRAKNCDTIILDSNILLLYIIGVVDENLIERHKRLRDIFTTNDFHNLCRLIGAPNVELLTIPNIASECSNIMLYGSEGLAETIKFYFIKIISEFKEIYISSQEISSTNEFLHLDLADAAILLILKSTDPANKKILLLTEDNLLYKTAFETGHEVAKLSVLT